MKAILSLVLLLAIASSETSKVFYNVEQSEQHFKRFVTQYGKKYAHKVEYLERLAIFAQNLQTINKLNQKEDDAVFAVGKFADLTAEEFKSEYLTEFTGIKETDEFFERKRQQQSVYVQDSQEVPENFDWREKGAVTPVSDQGDAGTCWSFSTADNVAGIWKNAGGNLVQLSKEQLIDCACEYNSQNGEGVCGVNGGWPYLALQYVHDNGGLSSDSEYPYCAGISGSHKCVPCAPECYQETYCGPAPRNCNQKCKNASVEKIAKIDGWKHISSDEEVMKKELYQNGPLSIVFNANVLQHYSSGVLNPSSCSNTPNHAVLMTGYGVSDIPYWTVKNSWGQNWGMQGYFKLRRGRQLCGINKYGVTAVIDSYNGENKTSQELK